MSIEDRVIENLCDQLDEVKGKMSAAENLKGLADRQISAAMREIGFLLTRVDETLNMPCVQDWKDSLKYIKDCAKGVKYSLECKDL